MTQAQPPVRRVLETSLYVADLDRAQAFYERLVMLRDHRMCALAVPGQQALLLFREGGSVNPSPTPFGVIPPHDAHGVQHLCFSIDHADLDRWAAHLEMSGVAIESRIAWPARGRSLYFRDPDGHSLEVGTSGLWPNDPVAAATDG
jgi:catechol 2,3-dioxygenase-like lactoylglutathione lyase family enzyme